MSAFLFYVICGANKNIKLWIINFDNLNYCCIFATTKRVQMNITTEDEVLLELYETGKTSDKRYRCLPVQAIKGYKKAVDYMKVAKRIEDLFPIKGLNYERLRGNRAGQESVRCNDTWRLIFRSSPIDGSIIITEIELLEITHHYD